MVAIISIELKKVLKDIKWQKYHDLTKYGHCTKQIIDYFLDRPTPNSLLSEERANVQCLQ